MKNLIFSLFVIATAVAVATYASQFELVPIPKKVDKKLAYIDGHRETCFILIDKDGTTETVDPTTYALTEHGDTFYVHQWQPRK